MQEGTKEGQGEEGRRGGREEERGAQQDKPHKQTDEFEEKRKRKPLRHGQTPTWTTGDKTVQGMPGCCCKQQPQQRNKPSRFASPSCQKGQRRACQRRNPWWAMYRFLGGVEKRGSKRQGRHGGAQGRTRRRCGRQTREGAGEAKRANGRGRRSGRAMCGRRPPSAVAPLGLCF